VGAAPYLAEVLPAPVTVISLGGVLSSTPKINRIDHLVHIYSDKDTVQRLGMIFPGRWRLAYTSAWNQGRRSGRISSILLPGVKHDGPGGYLDEERFLEDGRSYMDRTVDTIVEVINTKVQPIPDA
ncbi:MAG: CAAX protease, partial [Anaerolineae bacterium]|nr:CAAX protease [Anaerolineae bacterium]